MKRIKIESFKMAELSWEPETNKFYLEVLDENIIEEYNTYKEAYVEFDLEKGVQQKKG